LTRFSHPENKRQNYLSRACASGDHKASHFVPLERGWKKGRWSAPTEKEGRQGARVTGKGRKDNLTPWKELPAACRNKRREMQKSEEDEHFLEDQQYKWANGTETTL
jgi:hypothetical protein